MDQYIGKKIEGRYLVNELIGVGGMANVYKATDVTDGKTVAVKILREEFNENEEFLRRFKNESKAIAMLSHPNIIRVYDVCFSHGTRSIVMECVDGITLKEYMEEQAPLSLKETLHFVPQILRALSHAHKRGVIHRDIKPQNVMLLPDASIKLTDFGIARFARSETRTLTDRAIGSVHYISPEQARGEHTDQRADIYSVGVMLFEMLTGQLPFDADSPVTVALKQIESRAPSPRSLNPNIPEPLEAITMRAMQKDPERRYQSAGEMLADLEAYQQNPSVQFAYRYLTNPEGEQAHFEKKMRRVKESSRVDADATMALPSPQKKESALQKKEPQKLQKSPSRRRRPAPQEEKEERRPERNGNSIIMTLAGITAAFVVITIIFVVGMFTLNNPLEKVPEVVMPEFAGLKLDAVQTAAEYQKFSFEVEESEYNDLYERGEIVSQKPKAGIRVKENSIVKVVISNGTKVVLMPDLAGWEETAAYQELDRLEMRFQKKEVYSNAPIGTVVATNPAHGAEVPASTIVEVQVSMGPENKIVEVPDLAGMPLENAKNLLKAIGLEMGGISSIESERPSGEILGQNPEAGTQTVTGSYVDVDISGGTEHAGAVTLYISLPTKVEDIVKLQVMYDGTIIKEEQVQPSTAGSWRPMLQGSGTSTIFILYNDFLYQTFSVDFSNGSYQMTEDNSAIYQ